MMQVRWNLKPSTVKDKKTMAATFNPINERLKAHRDFETCAYEVDVPWEKKKLKREREENPGSGPNSPSPSPSRENRPPKKRKPRNAKPKGEQQPKGDKPAKPRGKKAKKAAAAADQAGHENAPASPELSLDLDGEVFSTFQQELNDTASNTSFFSEQDINDIAVCEDLQDDLEDAMLCLSEVDEDEGHLFGEFASRTDVAPEADHANISAAIAASLDPYAPETQHLLTDIDVLHDLGIDTSMDASAEALGLESPGSLESPCLTKLL